MGTQLTITGLDGRKGLFLALTDGKTVTPIAKFTSPEKARMFVVHQAAREIENAQNAPE